MEQQVKDLKAFRVLYDFCLADPHLVKVLQQTYKVQMELLKKWGEIDTKNFVFSDTNALFSYLPESFIMDIVEFQSHLLRSSPKGIKVFPADYLLQLVEFCVLVVRTEQCISNPYSKAKALQLVSYLIQADKKGEMANTITMGSQVIKDLLMETTIKFYVDIEFTGSSDSFYTKFNYRNDCSIIFKLFWPIEHYK